MLQHQKTKQVKFIRAANIKAGFRYVYAGLPIDRGGDAGICSTSATVPSMESRCIRRFSSFANLRLPK